MAGIENPSEAGAAARAGKPPRVFDPAVRRHKGGYPDSPAP